MPGATAWEAKNGVYMILKLDDDAMAWHSSYKIPNQILVDGGIASTLVDSQSGIRAQGGFLDLCTAGAATVNNPPFGPYGLWGEPNVGGTGATSNCAFHTMSNSYDPCTNNMGEMLFEGLNANAKLIITTRVGLEVLASPLSPYVTFMTSPIPYDPIAISSYHGIAREMLAAYPSEYNFLGALFNVVKGIG